MKRKVLGILLSMVMGLSLMTGCGNVEETADLGNTEENIGAKIEVKEEAVSDISVEGNFEGNELNVFIFAQEHEKAVYQSLIDKFQENTGAKVNFEVTTSDEYNQKILAYKAADDMPDIFYVGRSEERRVGKEC